MRPSGVVQSLFVLVILLGMFSAIGWREAGISLSEVNEVLAYFDVVVGMGKEFHEAEDGGRCEGSVEVIPSVRGQLISLSIDRAAK